MGNVTLFISSRLYGIIYKKIHTQENTFKENKKKRSVFQEKITLKAVLRVISLNEIHIRFQSRVFFIAFVKQYLSNICRKSNNYYQKIKRNFNNCTNPSLCNT